MFNMNMNRFGPNRPTCNNRQYGTVALAQQLDDMKLKPEYLGNEHFKFLNNFGLPKHFTSDKKFVEINNSVNHNLNQSKRMALNPNHITYSAPNILCATVAHTHFNHAYNNYNKQRSAENVTKTNDANQVETMTSKQVQPNKNIPTNYNSKNNSDITNNTSSTSMKHLKKNKRNGKTTCDSKGNQKSCKKSKKQKNFQKQSKKETDRNIINSMSLRKRKNKSKNRKCSKIEIMDINDLDQSIESPVSPLPQIQSCIEILSSPIKINMKINTTPSPPIFNFSPVNKPDIQKDHPNKTVLNGFRSRLPSECESEDSFIIFEDGPGNCDMDEDDDEDTEGCSSTSDDEESYESDTDFCSTPDEEIKDFDVVDFCRTSNTNWQKGASSPSKKVRFVEGKDLCVVHPMIQWSFAYKSARKGPWEEYARDRDRFKNRISNVAPILNVVLQPTHRDKIYKERFQDDD